MDGLSLLTTIPAPRDTELPPAVPRPMLRCECAEISFVEVARRMEAGGLTLDQVSRQTGCGRNCGACLPDLVAYLARRS